MYAARTVLNDLLSEKKSHEKQKQTHVRSRTVINLMRLKRGPFDARTRIVL